MHLQNYCKIVGFLEKLPLPTPFTIIYIALLFTRAQFEEKKLQFDG